MPLSAHCAPAVTRTPSWPADGEHIEYFHDHVRIEAELFDGVPEPVQGRLVPDGQRAGLGLALKAGADRFRA